MQITEPAEVAELVRELRSRLGLTQEQLAAKLEVTFVSVNRWENGKAKPLPIAMKLMKPTLLEMGDFVPNAFGCGSYLVKYF